MRFVTDQTSATAQQTYAVLLPPSAAFDLIPSEAGVIYSIPRHEAEGPTLTRPGGEGLGTLPLFHGTPVVLDRFILDTTGPELSWYLSLPSLYGREATGRAALVAVDYEPLSESQCPHLQNVTITSHPARNQNVESDVLSLFDGIVADEREDGMTSEVGRRVASLVVRRGAAAVDVFATLVSSEGVAPEILSHALRWVGRMKDPSSFHARLWLLRHSLRSISPVVRDGAALGLAALGSPLAIPSLAAAIEREQYRGLRQDMQQVLEELRERP